MPSSSSQSVLSSVSAVAAKTAPAPLLLHSQTTTTAQPLAALPPYGCGVPLAGTTLGRGRVPGGSAPYGFYGMPLFSPAHLSRSRINCHVTFFAGGISMEAHILCPCGGRMRYCGRQNHPHGGQALPGRAHRPAPAHGAVPVPRVPPLRLPDPLRRKSAHHRGHSRPVRHGRQRGAAHHRGRRAVYPHCPGRRPAESCKREVRSQ